MTHNIPTINDAQSLKELIRLNGLNQISTLILGKIGVGKSEIVKQLAEDIGGIFEDIRLSMLDNTDIKGLFKIEGNTTVWCPPKSIMQFTEPNVKGILFFDEINLANEDVQSAFYRVLLDREIEGHKISDGVIIVAAGNTSDEVPLVRTMSPALLNRLSIVNYSPTSNTIISYLTDKYLKSEKKLSEEQKKLISNVLMFIDSNKDLLIEEINQESEYSIFARPRGWERVLKLIVNSPDKKIKLEDKHIFNYINANIGSNASHKLITFVKNVNMLNINNYLEGKMKAEDLSEADKYVLISGIINYLDKQKETKSKEQMVKLIDEIYDVIVVHFKEDHKTMLVGWLVKKDDDYLNLCKDSKLYSVIINIIKLKNNKNA